MTPEEQKQFVELQDKLAATEKERDEHAAKVDALGKDIDELKKINQQLFLRATSPAPDKEKETDPGEKPFTSNELISQLTKKKGDNK